MLLNILLISTRVSNREEKWIPAGGKGPWVWNDGEDSLKMRLV